MFNGEEGLLPVGGFLVWGRAQPHPRAHLELEPAYDSRQLLVSFYNEFHFRIEAVEMRGKSSQVKILKLLS